MFVVVAVRTSDRRHIIPEDGRELILRCSTQFLNFILDYTLTVTNQAAKCTVFWVVMRGEEPDVSEESITSSFRVKKCNPRREATEAKSNFLVLSEYWRPGTTTSGSSNRTKYHFMPFAIMGPCISDIVCTKRNK
jgi:hypothetical protein